jgi:hypothetical protein
MARKSIVMLKRYGDIRSFYLTPLLSVMFFPATELMMTLDIPDSIRCFIHKHHIWGNPFAARMSRRKFHDSVSKILRISALKSMSYFLLVDAILMACCA